MPSLIYPLLMQYCVLSANAFFFLFSSKNTESHQLIHRNYLLFNQEFTLKVLN